MRWADSGPRGYSRAHEDWVRSGARTCHAATRFSMDVLDRWLRLEAEVKRPAGLQDEQHPVAWG